MDFIARILKKTLCLILDLVSLIRYVGKNSMWNSSPMFGWREIRGKWRIREWKKTRIYF